MLTWLFVNMVRHFHLYWINMHHQNIFMLVTYESLDDRLYFGTESSSS